MSDSETLVRRPKSRRECAEIAKKRLKIDFGVSASVSAGVRSSTDSGSSREGSCDRGSSCTASDKKCCLELSLNCQNGSGMECGGKVPTQSRNGSSDGSTNGNGGAGRSFHHVSAGEHFCQACYEEVSKPGRPWNDSFVKWKLEWMEDSRRSPTLRQYVADQLMPFWTQCTKCGKWRHLHRSVHLTNDSHKKFTCPSASHHADIKPCDVPEDPRVDPASKREWSQTLSIPPLLHNSPALHYLRSDYFHDEVGMSPTNADFSGKVPDSELREFLQPFNIPHEGTIALCLRPDVMEYDEIVQFPEYCSEAIMYLALRNLIAALWNMNPFEYLTLDKCIPYLICRGLARVWFASELDRVLQFLTVKGVVNYGILDPVKTPIVGPEYS
uniref:Uncharacterized protein n=1 Tax=Plectus sambesii TaxID=2011161 RepID=A0A914VP70_9BILA